jgi:hypothetical protein
MNDDYRITGYCENEDFCFIMDCYGMFEKLWLFSSLLVQKSFNCFRSGKRFEVLGREHTAIGQVRRQDSYEPQAKASRSTSGKRLEK